MYLDKILAAQKHGQIRGMVSICSAHPWVLRTAMQADTDYLLIEATCNQVNQFGGYTGMKPKDFVSYVHKIAAENNFPIERVLLGGDHLGPGAWQNDTTESAMDKSLFLAHEYVQAGFTKLHMDCSMRLGGDPGGALDIEISARRTAQMVKMAETSAANAHQLRDVIGTEVPVPGGAQSHEQDIHVTTVEAARQTIEVTREMFLRQGLEPAWERVIALVVQPGVEFGDDFVLEYQPHSAKDLSKFIESYPMVYEAHSTDYQPQEALHNLVRDHFAILKVGPALTYAFREGVFALAKLEDELVPTYERSNIISELEEVMLAHPEHWRKYYHGTEAEQSYKRKYSLSDRIRYYWSDPRVQKALNKLLTTLAKVQIPLDLLQQHLPETYPDNNDEWVNIVPEQVLMSKCKKVLEDYNRACGTQE